MSNFSQSLTAINTGIANGNARLKKVRAQMINPMIYALRTGQPLPRPYPSKEDVKNTKGLIARTKASQANLDGKKNEDLLRLYDDFNAGRITPENALGYLESQLRAL